ncbi:amidohydrolase [Sulfitobacter sp. F26169L]|uniref:amidohydrolase n=1 Tax=Sulfitobacter sp. F26169L TaxID=2996015 RepID=UPI002260C2E4|nr:amidohydrolase [Sulfitobacter sp. F26169L]MCX7567487.1 amidohydrolase [Sulfitobacter sp. F26169L]
MFQFRKFGLQSVAAAAMIAALPALAQDQQPADMIVLNAGQVFTDDEQNATAFAVRDGVFVEIGTDADVEAFRGEDTQIIDADGRTIIPGLNDSHSHQVRGGRFFNLETRWDGIPTLEAALDLIRTEADRVPEGEWVRVIGGWSPFQFAESRMPTVDELNKAAPDTPVFVLYLYSKGFLNKAGVEALGYTAETETADGSRIEILDNGGAILHAEPNPAILYKTIGTLPQMSEDDMVNSTRQFYRDLNRFGLTSATDAGGGGHVFPKDYIATKNIAENDGLPLRITTYLFAQEAGKEAEDFSEWIANNEVGENADVHLDHGYELDGAGEFLVHSVGDWENFLAPAPDLAERAANGQDPRGDLHEVTTMLVEAGWPLRQHATYGDSIALIMDVFEQVAEEQGKFAPRWAIDHAETVRDTELERIKALGGGIAIQNRMAFAGEYFVERYGAEAASAAPPIRKMLDMGIPVGAGTDGTRVSSYNPWPSLYWLVTGKTVGGLQLWDEANTLSREEALRIFTQGSAWFSQEEDVKGSIADGMYADFAILSDDYFSVPAEEIKSLEAVLTVTGGNVVYASDAFADHAPEPLPAVSPEWSPVVTYQESLNAR